MKQENLGSKNFFALIYPFALDLLKDDKCAVRRQALRLVSTVLGGVFGKLNAFLSLGQKSDIKKSNKADSDHGHAASSSIGSEDSDESNLNGSQVSTPNSEAFAEENSDDDIQTFLSSSTPNHALLIKGLLKLLHSTVPTDVMEAISAAEGTLAVLWKYNVVININTENGESE